MVQLPQGVALALQGGLGLLGLAGSAPGVGLHAQARLLQFLLRHVGLSQRHALRQLDQSAALQQRAYALGESPLVDLLLAQRGALDARLVTETAALDALQAHARLLLDAHRLWRLPEH